MLFFALPNLVMHGSIVFGCLGYLAWLSWPVCLLAVAAILVGSLGYHAGDKRAIASLEAAGRSQDKLFGYLGALFTGAKELKLHQARSRQFVDGQLGSAIDEVRDHRRQAFSAYAVGVGWIVFLFYVFLASPPSGRRSACTPMRRRHRATWWCSCSCCCRWTACSTTCRH
jgi:ABC-type siderophore export system, fused ATPase and permease components